MFLADACYDSKTNKKAAKSIDAKAVIQSNPKNRQMKNDQA